MALAKWARKEESKPGSLKTRTDVDEWLLPDISRFDTIHTVLQVFIILIYKGMGWNTLKCYSMI